MLQFQISENVNTFSIKTLTDKKKAFFFNLFNKKYQL